MKKIVPYIVIISTFFLLVWLIRGSQYSNYIFLFLSLAALLYGIYGESLFIKSIKNNELVNGKVIGYETAEISIDNENNLIIIIELVKTEDEKETIRIVADPLSKPEIGTIVKILINNDSTFESKIINDSDVYFSYLKIIGLLLSGFGLIYLMW